MSGANDAESAVAGRRFAFLSHQDMNLARFRLPLMARLSALGARVFAVAPRLLDEDPFGPHGVDFVPIDMSGASAHPTDARSVARLGRLLDEVRPDVLQTFMLKPNLIGGWLARRDPDVCLISTVTGLGRLYEPREGLVPQSLRWSADQLLRRAFSQASAVVFQNPDDRQEALERRLCAEGKARLILSSGVDLQEFSRAAVDPARVAALRRRWGLGSDLPVVTMVARLLPSKGVREFAAAARALRGRARFVLIGPLELSASMGRRNAIQPEEVEAWRRSGALIATGTQLDIQAWLAMSAVYALPSYYREGVPRSVLEAMAMGLPIVTTRMPGCKETVPEGRNGVLVPPRDVGALTRALDQLLDDPSLRERMGSESRALAERRFSSDAVIAQHLGLYRGLLQRPAGVPG